jgi:hypothetical protein
MLAKILDQQIKHQTLLGVAPEKFTSAEAKLQYIRNTCLALHKECSEFLDELPWKPWVALEDQQYNQSAAAEEIVDIIIFALNLWIHIGAYPTEHSGFELGKQIRRKQDINMRRIEKQQHVKL